LRFRLRVAHGKAFGSAYLLQPDAGIFQEAKFFAQGIQLILPQDHTQQRVRITDELFRQAARPQRIR
jgi:hypothetical protein